MSRTSQPPIIPIAVDRGGVEDTVKALPPVATGGAAHAPDASIFVRDALGRPLSDLRISVTDRCNFRCGYCMPRSAFGANHPFLPHAALLSFEEIARCVNLMLPLGVRKLRLTGGEPLLRKNLDRLIAQLASLKTTENKPPELALTTNGVLLKRQAKVLKEAGLDRVTVSLDALDDAVFQRMSDSQFTAKDVLEGLDAALAVGLQPIKVNMVVQRGVNDNQILPMAQHFRGSGIELRFIEFMDVGQTNRWQLEHVVPSTQVREWVHHRFPLVSTPRSGLGDTAERWAYADGQGHIGLISSVTQAFCGACNRLRLSTDGRLYTCLFAHQGHDLRGPLRQGEPDNVIRQRLAALWAQRSDHYSELRSLGTAQPTAGARVEMSFIGG